MPQSSTRTDPKTNDADPSLLFSPAVKAKTASTGRPVNSVKISAEVSKRSPPAVSSTKWLTQTRQEQEMTNRKSQPQKLAVGRKMLAPSAHATGKLRTQPLDPLGKTSTKSTGTSVTVVRRIVKVPARPARPEIASRTSTSPDVTTTETSSGPSSSRKSKSNKGSETSRPKASRRQKDPSALLSSVDSAKLLAQGDKGNKGSTQRDVRASHKSSETIKRADGSRKTAVRPVKRNVNAKVD
ncbi:hypothetical protein EIP86_000310 [Pleurotus ostreatoroseus]|nr:hypothetical protein EIP86_000310 [Pleurotus ostreatoroseus]